MTQLLENRLANVLLKDKNHPGGTKWRAFSHISTKPEEVEEWVPVDLEELGGTVYFDHRSCEIMNEADLTIYIAKKRQVPFLHAVGVSPPKNPETQK